MIFPVCDARAYHRTGYVHASTVDRPECTKGVEHVE